jgi:hypothetical protein
MKVISHSQRSQSPLFWFELSVLFESEEWPSMEPRINHGATRDRTTTHRPLMNIRSLSLWYGVRPEKVPWKMWPDTGLIQDALTVVLVVACSYARNRRKTWSTCAGRTGFQYEEKEDTRYLTVNKAVIRSSPDFQEIWQFGYVLDLLSTRRQSQKWGWINRHLFRKKEIQRLKH